MQTIDTSTETIEHQLSEIKRKSNTCKHRLLFRRFYQRSHLLSMQISSSSCVSSLLFSLCSFIHRLIIRRHIVFIHCHILANSFETTRISTTGKKTGMRVENIFVIIADRLATSPEVVSVFLSHSSIISEPFYCYLLYEFWVESQNFSFHSTVEYDDSDYDMRYEYRDRERELYELERDREERELERER